MLPPTRFKIAGPNLDSALRYRAVIQLFADIYHPDLAVLEVGSGSAGITEFLNHAVTGLDASFERTANRKSELLEKVRGAATRLPFSDRSYDVVLSVDMLEHVPPKDRQICLAEMVRVLRPGGRAIIAFPADTAGERLDLQLDKAYRKRHARDHPWLIEHIERGLPRTKDIVGLARDLTYGPLHITVHKQLWGPLWYLVHRIHTVGLPNWRGLWRVSAWSAAILFHLANYANFSPAYRTILVLDKGKPLLGHA
jgi:SAM-dependent methyltransferase